MKILRWIAVIPVSLVAYALVKVVWSLTTYPFMPELISYLNQHKDFGPWIIWGPVYDFSSQGISAGVAILAASKIAPQGRERIAQFVMAGIWGVAVALGLITMYAHSYPPGVAFRTYIGMAAEIFGIVGSFSYKPNPDAV